MCLLALIYRKDKLTLHVGVAGHGARVAVVCASRGTLKDPRFPGDRAPAGREHIDASHWAMAMAIQIVDFVPCGSRPLWPLWLPINGLAFLGFIIFFVIVWKAKRFFNIYIFLMVHNRYKANVQTCS